MRIPKSWVRPLTEKIVAELLDKGLAEPVAPMGKLLDEAEALMLEELMVEDRLNDEVRQMLRRFDREIEAGRLDYKKLFDLTKQKIVKERNLVL
jgi:hypothetical protein